MLTARRGADPQQVLPSEGIPLASSPADEPTTLRVAVPVLSKVPMRIEWTTASYSRIDGCGMGAFLRRGA